MLRQWPFAYDFVPGTDDDVLYAATCHSVDCKSFERTVSECYSQFSYSSDLLGWNFQQSAVIVNYDQFPLLVQCNGYRYPGLPFNFCLYEVSVVINYNLWTVDIVHIYGIHEIDGMAGFGNHSHDASERAFLAVIEVE